jgi:hypothetical protein
MSLPVQLPPDPETGRRPWGAAAVGVGVALLVVVGALTVPLWTAADEPPTLDAVLVVQKPGSGHVAGDVDYDQSPPAGGDHDAAWLECGVYDEPVRDENAVHSLEHGTVWVTHDLDLDAEAVASLARRLPEKSIVSPYDGLPGPVVVTVWGRQLVLDDADDPRLELFLREFGDGHTAPEPFASCRGGVTGDEGDGQTTQA